MFPGSIPDDAMRISFGYALRLVLAKLTDVQAAHESRVRELTIIKFQQDLICYRKCLPATQRFKIFYALNKINISDLRNAHVRTTPQFLC